MKVPDGDENGTHCCGYHASYYSPIGQVDEVEAPVGGCNIVAHGHNHGCNEDDCDDPSVNQIDEVPIPPLPLNSKE